MILNNNQIGENALKGGYFTKSALVPNGSFSVKKNYLKYEKPSEEKQKSIVLTLQKIKDSLKKELLNQKKVETIDGVDVNQFLFETMKLLIDYSDIRNYVFYGSAHTEIVYNIDTIRNSYPYKFYIANELESKIKISYNKEQNISTIIFDKKDILEGQYEFNYYDNDTTFNWLNYNLIDQNNKKYPIKKVYTPFTDDKNTGLLQTFYLLKNANNELLLNLIASNIENGQIVSIRDIEEYIPDGEYIAVKKSGFQYQILDKFTNEVVTYTGAVSSEKIGNIRIYPPDMVNEDFQIKVFVKGQFINENLSFVEGKYGFIISPNEQTITDFQLNLNDIQKMLLSPIEINSTPWPRAKMTRNILSDENNSEFISWLKNENFLYKPKGDQSDEVFYGDESLYNEYNLVRAISLDESETNNIIRKFVPEEMISELNDTEDFYFQRFLLILGWFFDQIRVYTKFIKYVHHLNYTEFNQLSPEYYKYYASYYGLDVFTDEDLDLSSLLIKTQKGLAYQGIESDSEAYNQSYEKLQYQRQKRFLLGLMYLYQSKGSFETLKLLVSLLGSPENLFYINEFSMKFEPNGFSDSNGKITSKTTIIENNNKIFCPKVSYEIDEVYTKASGPTVYKQKLSNENEINLRVINALTSPNDAIDTNLIEYFKNKKYNYFDISKGVLMPDGSSELLLKPYESLTIEFEYMLPDNFRFNNAGEEKIDIIHLFNGSFSFKIKNLKGSLFVEFNSMGDIVSGEIKDFFRNDGLNRNVKVILNKDGFYVFNDFKSLGLEDKNPIGFIPWNYTVIFPSTESNYTLLLGWYNYGISKFYLTGFSIVENYMFNAYGGYNNSDNINAYTSRTHYFKSIKDGYLTASVVLPYYNGDIDNVDYPEDYKVFVSITESVSLVQDFFTKLDIFKYNAYEENYKKKDEYRLFNGIINNLYENFSNSVISYDSLSGFLKLIETKFRPMIENFIPIVVEISEFGRLVKSSQFNLNKFRYYDVEKYCKISDKTEQIINIDFKDIFLTNEITFKIRSLADVDIFSIDIEDATLIPLTIYKIIVGLNAYDDIKSWSLNDRILNISIPKDAFPDLKVTIFPNGETTPIYEQNFKIGDREVEVSNCGSIEYKEIEQNDDRFYIFDKSENFDTFIYNKIEEKQSYINRK